MGFRMSKLLQKQRIDVLMLGLKNSGKTTLLYKLLEKEQRKIIPTFGFNMEILSFADIDLDVMDVGGDEKILPLWKHYQLHAGALIYVIDDDVTMMEKNRELLSNILSWPDRKSIPLLIIYNKTGRSHKHILYVEDIIEKLNLQKTCKNRNYKVQFVAYNSYSGLNEAITWLCSILGSSIAAKNLKQLKAKQAKKSRKLRYKKRKKNKERDLIPSVLPNDREKEQMANVLNVRPIHPSLRGQIQSRDVSNSRSTCKARGRIDRKSIIYKESFGRIDKFFKSQEEKRIEPRVRFESNRNSVSEDSVPCLIDTMSTDPFSPISPRRHGTMVRLNEFMERRRNAPKHVQHNNKTVKPLTPSKLTKILKFFQHNQFPLDADQKDKSRKTDSTEYSSTNYDENDETITAETSAKQKKKQDNFNENKLSMDITYSTLNKDLLSNNSTVEKCETIAPDDVLTAPKTSKSQPETSQVHKNTSLTHNHETSKKKQKSPPRKVSQHDIQVNTALLNRVPGAAKNEQRSNERKHPKNKDNGPIAAPKKKRSSRKRKKRKQSNATSNSDSFLNPPSPNLRPVSPVKASVQTIIEALRFGGKRNFESVKELNQSTSSDLQTNKSIDTKNGITKVGSFSKPHNLLDDHSKNFSVGESYA